MDDGDENDDDDPDDDENAASIAEVADDTSDNSDADLATAIRGVHADLQARDADGRRIGVGCGCKFSWRIIAIKGGRCE